MLGRSKPLMLAATMMLMLMAPLAASAQSNSPLGPLTSGCVGGAACPTNYGAVQNCGSFIGRDEGYSVYAGGNFTLLAGAEGEGRFYVKGNIQANAGLYNIVAVGVGSCVTPPDTVQPHVESSNAISASNMRVGELLGMVSDVRAMGSITGTVWAGGTIVQNAPSISPEPIGFPVLKTRSDAWAALPANGTVVAGTWGPELTGDGTSTRQVFNISGNTIPNMSNNWVQFKQIPANATVLINVLGTGTVTLDAADYS